MACSNQKNNVARVRQITFVGMIVNVVLSCLKFVAGVIGSSSALVADAVHSLSDMGTDVAIIWGAKYWTAPADENHPYGHGKIETIITVLIGGLLGSVAIGLGYNAFISLKQAQHPSPSKVAFIVALLSIGLKEVLYQWSVRQGKSIKSSALIANAWHHRSDALSSIPVALAVIVAIVRPDLAFVDHLGAVVVSLFIFYAAVKIIKPAFSELLDGAAAFQIKQEVKATAMSTKGVMSVHAIRSRNVGSGIFVDFHIMVDGQMSVRRGHDISREVKENLMKKNEDIVDVVVHLEPYE